MIGGVGWTPDKFYESEVEDSIDALIGYFERQRDAERIQRRAALMIVSPWVDKKVDPYQWWPIAGDDDVKGEIRQTQKQKMLARLRKLKHDEAVKKYNGGKS